MNWLSLLMEALEDAHEDHTDSYAACDCYERLRDGLVGVYRFPEVSHDVQGPPVYGCEEFSKYHMRVVMEKIEGDIMRGNAAWSAKFQGLAEHMRPR